MELTSKQRAQLRGIAAGEDTIIHIGKDGISENLIKQANDALEARELIKGKVLESALMSAREVSEAICEATGADGVSCVGNKFVIYRFSEKCQAERNATGRAHRKPTPKSKADPVGKGARARRQAARKVREQRNEYFRQQAIEKAIEKSRERQLREQLHACYHCGHARSYRQALLHRWKYRSDPRRRCKRSHAVRE